MKLYAHKVSLDRLGYDHHGRYFGVGSGANTLYKVTSDDGEISEHVRAASAAAARKQIAVQKGLRQLTAKERGYHRSYDSVTRLRTKIRAQSYITTRDLAQASRLSDDLRRRNPNDVGWRYYLEDMEHLHGA